MLKTVGFKSMEAMISATVPENIRRKVRAGQTSPRSEIVISTAP